MVTAGLFLPMMMTGRDNLKMIANHGQSRRYYHDVVGCNSRLDTIQAAILDIKLTHLDEYVAARRSAADFYDQAFSGNKKITRALPGPLVPSCFSSIYTGTGRG